MYQFVLCLRYLGTRYIALASIISVMLGVATMIVVNSVMDGFRTEMHRRLQGILSDVVFETLSVNGVIDAEGYQAEIERTVEEKIGPGQIDSMTAVVTVPGMFNMKVRDQWITRPLTVIGVDSKTYAKVSDFSRYLLHPENRQQLSFMLREGGYDTLDRDNGDRVKERKQLLDGGWPHRRARETYEQSLEKLRAVGREAQRQNYAGQDGPGQFGPVAPAAHSEPLPAGAPPMPGDLPPASDDPFGGPPPIHPPDADSREAAGSGGRVASEAAERGGFIGPLGRTPFVDRPVEEAFNNLTHQHTGIILGIGITSMRRKNTEGEVEDYFLAVPGDDVKITFPTASTPPKAVSETFTIVDLYESKMSEYDSGFAFVPLEKLQQLRGMMDPLSGAAAFTSIQIKLKPGADRVAVRDAIRERFPPQRFPFRVQTWMDMQGPLLQAVQMETTILNVLLFMIIAVAGFGILATFFMIVVEKTRDIGVMKSLGASSSGVLGIFLSYGFSLGTVGAGVGALLGLLFVHYINDIAAVIEWITGREVFDPTIYYFREIPTVIQPFTVAWIVAGAVLIALLASILPALRAARLHPVEALRYE